MPTIAEPCMGTRDAIKSLGCPYYRLYYLLRSGKLEPPRLRDSGGRFLWTADDLEAARAVLAKPEPASAKVGEQ